MNGIVSSARMAAAIDSIKNARCEILAISELDADPWHTIDSPYVEENCRAAKRGIRIRRLFLQRGDHAISTELRWVLERYKRSGVACRFARYAELSREHDAENYLLGNLLIVDRGFLSRSTGLRHEGTTVTAVDDETRAKIASAVTQFDSWWYPASDDDPRVEHGETGPDVDVMVIGAGAVGVNTALFLDKLGFDVLLTDAEGDILRGSTRATFLNHGDGLEYFKRDNRTTGKECIDGAFVKGLIYPMDLFDNRICDAQRPVRFFVAAGSEREVGLENFYENAEEMQRHFAAQFQSIRDEYRFSDEDMVKRFLRTPESFQKPLHQTEYEDDVVVEKVLGGCAGSSFGVDMANYYGVMRAALEESRVRFIADATIDAIEKRGEWYRVRTTRGAFNTRDVVIAAGHRTFSIASLIRQSLQPLFEGSYHLRAMTIVRLPRNRPEMFERARRIDFTVQGEAGGMYACFRAPTNDRDGLAAIYWPSVKGSHVMSHRFDARTPSAPPAQWDELTRHDALGETERAREILKHAASLYRVLQEDGVTIDRTIHRTVFSVGRPADRFGTELNVRFMQHRNWSVTDDDRVTIWLSPKWTNAELVALTAARHVYRSIRRRPLPPERKVHFGPDRIDVPTLLDFRHITRRDIVRYASEYEHREGYAS